MSKHREKIVTTPRPKIESAPQKPQNINQIVFGPGKDNYGRDKSPLTEKDNCVSCGKETPYLKITHIDYRAYYVEGAGQLCKTCYLNIYNKNESSENL
jgi:hypothetical protein